MRDRLRRVFSVADLFRQSRQSYQKYDSFVPRYDSWHDSVVPQHDSFAEAGAVATLGQVAS